MRRIETQLNAFIQWNERGSASVFIPLGEPPARLTVEQVAWLLNCQPHDVPVLISTRVLKPLGNPAPNGIKFFATSEIIESMKERTWLNKVTVVINQHWHKQNALKKRRDQGNGGDSSRELATAA